MKAIIIPLIFICNLCWGQKEFNIDSCGVLSHIDGGVVTIDARQWNSSIVVIDTIPTILLFIENSNKNGSRECRWAHGYKVVVSSFPEYKYFYLDYRKRRLPKNVIVFMSIN